MKNEKKNVTRKKKKQKTKTKRRKKNETFVQICHLLYTQISVSGGPWNNIF